MAMAELGQQTVQLSTLVSRTGQDSYNSLKELVDKCRSTESSDTDKKISMLKFLNKTRQRMIRLNVLTKWCQQVGFFLSCLIFLIEFQLCYRFLLLIVIYSS